MKGEPLRYLAGYIAYRFKRTHPNLGSKIGQHFSPCNAPDWISMLSKSGLTAPSDSFMFVIKQFEERFQQYYGPTGLHTCNNVVYRLQQYLMSTVKYEGVPVIAVRLYALLRTFIRMRRVAAADTAAKLARQARRKKKKYVT
jgi:hypothetical protein